LLKKGLLVTVSLY